MTNPPVPICDTCGGPMTTRQSSASAPYFYRMGGLPSAALVGVTVNECAPCNTESPVIPKPGELHRVITRALLEKSTPLNGVELRFLRKTAGFKAQKFAALIGLDPAYLSRVEHGRRRHLGVSTERLARAIVAAAVEGGEAARQVLLEAAESTDSENSARGFDLFALERNRWKSVA